jgi:DNA-directed RNA polymerase subunit H (RpoH/RPB5)
MRLEIASKKAIDYACRYFHYAKKAPIVTCAYSVFNDKNEWCGVICYGRGNNPHISSRYNLNNGEVVELVRVALNGKQGFTSMALAISLKLLKKHNPLLKLIVSYADTNQNHLGIIYQATNWYFHYYSKPAASSIYLIDKHKTLHNRGLNNQEKKRLLLNKQAIEIKQAPKIKYLYPLDEETTKLCKKLAKPYPKKINANIV